MTEAEKKRIQENLKTEEEDPEKLRAMQAARSVSYLTFAENKEAFARAAGLDERNSYKKLYRKGKLAI
jgi:hypothetical protein